MQIIVNCAKSSCYRSKNQGFDTKACESFHINWNVIEIYQTKKLPTCGKSRYSQTPRPFPPQLRLAMPLLPSWPGCGGGAREGEGRGREGAEEGDRRNSGERKMRGRGEGDLIKHGLKSTKLFSPDPSPSILVTLQKWFSRRFRLFFGHRFF